MPCRGPSGRPAIVACSAAFASVRAVSAVTVMKVLMDCRPDWTLAFAASLTPLAPGVDCAPDLEEYRGHDGCAPDQRQGVRRRRNESLQGGPEE
jgi:hypothetical protein